MAMSDISDRTAFNNGTVSRDRQTDGERKRVMQSGDVERDGAVKEGCGRQGSGVLIEIDG